MMSERLGILGGAFDPIHFGHLLLASEAHHQLKLDRVLFLPTFESAHQNKKIDTPYMHRVAMTELAIAAYPEFEICDIERRLGGTSYSVKTLEALAKEYPDAKFIFMIGADNVEQLDTWFEPERLTQLATLAVVARPGHKLKIEESEKVVFLNMPQIGISASLIRKRVREGVPVRMLLPAVVERYIKNEGLYGG